VDGKRLGPNGLQASANVSLLFRGHPFCDALRMAADAGFAHVEAWWPFSSAFPEEGQVDQVLEVLEQHALQLTGLNFYAGDMAAGERGVLSHPDAEATFREHVPIALDIARRAGCCLLNALYGNRSSTIPEGAQREAALRSYAFAAERAREQGATVLLETVNPHENPLYPVTRLNDAAAIVSEVGGPAAGIGLLFDAYHVQRTEGDLVARFRRHAELVRHVQVADAPGRSAPGTGEIAFERLLPMLQDAGYDGVVGLEYARSADDEGFGWIDDFGRWGSGGRQQ
jgi:hydroxypyruvate isomerase